jgi:hypothetical protein
VPLKYFGSLENCLVEWHNQSVISLITSTILRTTSTDAQQSATSKMAPESWSDNRSTFQTRTNFPTRNSVSKGGTARYFHSSPHAVPRVCLLRETFAETTFSRQMFPQPTHGSNFGPHSPSDVLFSHQIVSADVVYSLPAMLISQHRSPHRCSLTATLRISWI